MPPSTRQKMILEFQRKHRVGKPFDPRKIQEDDPQGRWNPGLQGNRKWGKKYRGAANYAKGRGRAD